MGVTELIVLQKALQAAVNILGAGKTPAGQKATVHDTQKHRSLIEPRAVFGRDMQDMAVAWITQEGPALPPFFALRRFQGHLAPPSHQAANVQTPVRVQVVQDPIIPFHRWQDLRRPLEMRHEIGGLPGGPKGPSDGACGHCQGMDQSPRTMADVLMFTPFAPARLGRCGGGFALEHVPAGLFVAANHPAALLIRLDRLGVKLANPGGLGINILVMALPPVRTLVGREVTIVQETPETGAADGLGVPRVKHSGHNRIECPAGDGALLVLRQWAGHREDLSTSRGSNRAWTPWASGILPACEAQGEGAPSPRAHGMSATAQSAADGQIGRGVGICCSQDNASTEAQRLRRGGGSHESL
jgi:hypothetical protein